MSHDYHQGLDTYHRDQILHDGCAECEYRAEHPETAIANLDVGNFERAWARAAAWQTGNGDARDTLSRAEVPVLRLLWAVQVQLERRGVPVGHCPGMEVLAGW